MFKEEEEELLVPGLAPGTPYLQHAFRQGSLCEGESGVRPFTGCTRPNKSSMNLIVDYIVIELN